jgi:hypothetical protein
VRTVLYLLFILQNVETGLLEDQYVLQQYPSQTTCESHLTRILASPIAPKAGLIGRCITPEQAQEVRKGRR